MSHHTSVSAWTPVKDFEDSHEVNPYGQVRTIAREITTRDGTRRAYQQRTLKPTKYGVVTLSRNGGAWQKSTAEITIESLGHLPLDPEVPEIWYPVPGHEDDYEVSDYYRVLDVERDELLPVVRGGVTLDSGGGEPEVVYPWILCRRAHARRIEDWEHPDLDRIWRAVPNCPGYEISGTRAVRKVKGPIVLSVLSTKGNEFMTQIRGRRQLKSTYAVHRDVFPELAGRV